MAKTRKVEFVCQQCGYRNPQWLGRCPECREYNSLVEEATLPEPPNARPRISDMEKPVPITEVSASDRPRIVVGIPELDRVFGGGVVPGSVVLVGGDPGIGKSTLILQMCDRLAKSGAKVLYVSAEESVQQTRLRADRLDVGSPNLFVVCETSLDAIVSHAETMKPAHLVVDSIQMVYRPEMPSAPGTVGQVRECAAQLVYLAKRTGTSVYIVGHVTKEGQIAGPRTLEHLVDAVFYFEGDRYQSYRILRAVKNRFGSTQELGIFEMRSRGLTPVDNPSEVFLSPGREGRTGSVVMPTLLGTRTLLAEVQALTNSFRTERPAMRRVSGVDPNRLTMVLAVLIRRLDLELFSEDIFVNVTGGVQIEEPAADLAVALSVAGASWARAVDHRTIAFGEVGLGGEVRGVPQAEARLVEAARLGFTRAIVPRENLRSIEAPVGLEVRDVGDLREAMEAAELR